MLKLKILIGFYILTLLGGNLIANPNAMFQTDRHCYISGDMVLFKVVIPHNEKESTLYVDLTSEDHVFIKGEILPLDNGICSGFIQIPDTIKTGNYFLRTYTYTSKESIKEQVLGENKIYVTNRFGNNAELYHNQNHYNYKNDSVSISDITRGDIGISFNKSTFKKRELVQLETMISSPNTQDFNGVIAVRSVSPCEQQCDDRNGLWWRNGKLENRKFDSSLYVNENKGMLISGEARNLTTGSVLENLAVILTFQDTVIRFKYSITDSVGRFNFMIDDCYEQQDIYLVAYSFPDLELYTNVKFEFDSKFIINGFDTTSNDELIGYQHSKDSLNLLKSVISKAYNFELIEQKDLENKNALSYEHKHLCGEFNRVTYIDDYIDLPDFYQIAKEILPFVKIREKDNYYTFELYDGENHVLKKDPIVFVDGVPLTNYKEIISWGSSKIKKVEVKVEPRYYGDLPIEQGMVFIWTKKQDFWKNAECPHTHKFTISGYQSSIKYNFPNYSNKNDTRIPDYRQIIYWNPDVSISTNETISDEFYTSDEVGVFEVCIAGVLDDGNPIYIRRYIEVK